MKRNLLRMLRSMLGAGSTFFIACAYGPVETGLVSGRVTLQGDGLGNVSVCAVVGQENQCVRTESDGRYFIDASSDAMLDQAAADGFTVCAEDDQGVAGTPLGVVCREVPPHSVSAVVDIEMQP